jgi:hypothetical protein
MIAGTACDHDGPDGGNGNKSAAVKVETQPVDLPPGQTEALMAWEPSDGPVEAYMVFVSRNGSVFEFEITAADANTMIPGEAGDEVRILVIALSENGALSETSPPSAPVRFHAAIEESRPVAAATSVFEPAASLVATDSRAFDSNDSNSDDD